MKVKCLKCNTEYNVSIDKILAGGATATCRKCGNKIKVSPPNEGKEKKDRHIQSQSVSPVKKESKAIEESKDQETAIFEIAFADITDVPLWNPNAIGCWSLLFTPLFGSTLTFMNWRALGEDKEAKKVLVWILISTLVLVAFLFILDAAVHILGRAAYTLAPAAAVYIYILARAVPLGIVAFILVWYFFLNRPQAKYFRIELNNQYIKKKWGKPLGLALGGLVGYLVCIAMAISIAIFGLYNTRGALWAGLGAHDRAIANFTRALEIDPNDGYAYALRGMAWYKKGDYDRAIGDFTEALEIDPRDADIFVSRGNAWDNKGDHYRAIADYNNAIELDPSCVRAYTERGAAYARNGDYERAIRDFNTAIILDPNNASAYRKRGTAFFYQARFAFAEADYKTYLRMKPKDIYRMLWLCMAQERAGKSSLHELSDNVKNADLGNWPGPVASVFLERISPEELFEETKDDDQKEEKERQCEAYFYLGQYYLLKSDKEKAAQMFKLCLETRVIYFIEYTGAKVELERMGLE